MQIRGNYVINNGIKKISDIPSHNYKVVAEKHTIHSREGKMLVVTILDQ